MFLTYLLTILPIILGGGNSVTHIKTDKKNFFSKEYTTILKGLCCLIVIYVHIHEPFTNTLQDAIGSFAYVCVTLFFLVSAYGMIKSIEHKDSYMKSFWRNRLVALLVPCLLINIVAFGLEFVNRGEIKLSTLYHLNGYVAVLLEWCVWFYIVEKCRLKWFKDEKILTDIMLIGGVVVSSLYYYFFIEGNVSVKSGWCFERIGLVWGVLLYRYYGEIVSWMDCHRWIKVAILTVISVILGILYLKYKFVYFYGAYLLKVILGLALVTLLFTATSNYKFGNGVSKWLGNISYEVYLSHGIVMGTMALYFSQIESSGWFIIATFVVTLFLSTCIHAIGKPIVKRLRKV